RCLPQRSPSPRRRKSGSRNRAPRCSNAHSWRFSYACSWQGSMSSSLPRREVVLVGAGHTNVHVLDAWGTRPIPGARLTCVSEFPIATYSGMLPGVLAGQYASERMEIDLPRLCAAVGAEFVTAKVT